MQKNNRMMATITKKTTNNTERNNIEKPKKLSKLGQWRRDNPEGIMIVKDPAVLHGLSVYEILN